MEIKNGYYRVSVKALILDSTRTKFLLVQEDNGKWDLPGGGLDWGELPQEGIIREIKEEMGLNVTKVASQPSYLTTGLRNSDAQWTANVLFETVLENLSFTPSSECVAFKFVTKEEATAMDTTMMVKEFLKVFNLDNHI